MTEESTLVRAGWDGFDLASADEDVAAESEVRLYCRDFPVTFARAHGSTIVSTDGREYVDLLCGAGALNLGHNHPALRAAVVSYLLDDGLVHALDMNTAVKADFLRAIQEVLLAPRRLDHRVQFCGPTGANAVEAALKLARRVTGRVGVVAFSGGFHGMSLGALSVSARMSGAASGGVAVAGTTFVPYPDGPGGAFDTVGYLARQFADPSSGLGLPAAVIVESVQMDGGVYVLPPPALRELADLCARHEVLLILDEIQTGCGRTGTYFGFEPAGVVPDMITVSKSISGIGLPLSLLLLRPALDIWRPGEHTGTFRANQLALVGAVAGLRLFQEPGFAQRAGEIADLLQRRARIVARRNDGLQARGRGAVAGLDFAQCGGVVRATAVQQRCFERGVLFELCGRGDTVVKLMPALTIEPDDLERALTVVDDELART